MGTNQKNKHVNDKFENLNLKLTQNTQ